jgi:hypothetical protein
MRTLKEADICHCIEIGGDCEKVVYFTARDKNLNLKAK